MVGWHHQFNGHELGQTPGDGEGQGGLHGQQSMGSCRVGHDLVTEQHCGTTPGLQHAKLLCTSLSPRVCSDSCPLSQ